jgi:hypothetical protein
MNDLADNQEAVEKDARSQDNTRPGTVLILLQPRHMKSLLHAINARSHNNPTTSVHRLYRLDGNSNLFTIYRPTHNSISN